ncbi:MAG: response regulator transcription factor [Flavobacteriales bacterium]|nr:response regulator transcription factor [Flavobacteriales bacterium]
MTLTDSHSTLQIIILEDEAIASRRLIRLLHEVVTREIQVVETFQTVAALIRYLENHPHPDLLLLDIMVADGTSFELFDHVEPQCPFIFVTAYDEFAVQAFRKHALDYLLKPIKRADLRDALERLPTPRAEDVQKAEQELSPYRSSFLIRFANKLTPVQVADIAYIHSSEKMAFFYLKNGQRIASDLRLQELINKLDPQKFIRANRQFIIHRESIDEVFVHSRSRLKVTLLPAAPETLIISTEMTPEFKKWLDGIS